MKDQAHLIADERLTAMLHGIVDQCLAETIQLTLMENQIRTLSATATLMALAAAGFNRCCQLNPSDDTSKVVRASLVAMFLDLTEDHDVSE